MEKVYPEGAGRSTLLRVGGKARLVVAEVALVRAGGVAPWAALVEYLGMVCGLPGSCLRN